MILHLAATVKSLAASRHALAIAKAELAEKVDELAFAKAEAIEANRAKSAFLAQMSHELRTPLNAVIGFSEILARKDEVLGTVPEIDAADYADHIHSSGQHLLSLVNDILDLAKIEAGKFTLSLRELDLRDVLLDAVSVTRAMADKREQFINLAPRTHTRTIEADERAALQILMNLLSNAVKYSPEGSQIDIAVEHAPDRAIVRVADQGPGMTEDQIECALQPYARLDHEIARKSAGTGLGLPIVNALVEMHGGRLGFERRPEGGTLVTVDFPIRQDTAQTGETAAA